ncbi:preprotein translocase subunit YajC [Segnochrobactraceae bacterium EtOH-i3]
MFVTPAFAQAAGGGSDTTAMLMQFVPFVLIFAIMYFLIIRPQRQRAKAHQEMVKNLRRGDTVLTAGGFVGRILKVVDDNELLVDIGENVKVRLLRTAVTEVRAKGEPVNDNAA